MIPRDLHVHSAFSDGHDTPEDIVLEALSLGMDTIGFSDHSYTEPDSECTLSLPRYAEYTDEIARLKEKYRGRIRVLCGMEQDLESSPPPDGLDYLIGSVHLIPKNGTMISVDWKPEILINAVRDLYDGDPLALCEDYYARTEKLAETECGIVGHFDLISKFSEKAPWFDPAHPRYIAAWKKAADTLLSAGKTFELNTGAISRGWRTSPYPRIEMLEYIRERGGRFILGSDSHRKDTLRYEFDRYESLLTERDLGGPYYQL